MVNSSTEEPDVKVLHTQYVLIVQDFRVLVLGWGVGSTSSYIYISIFCIWQQLRKLSIVSQHIFRLGRKERFLHSSRWRRRGPVYLPNKVKSTRNLRNNMGSMSTQTYTCFQHAWLLLRTQELWRIEALSSQRWMDGRTDSMGCMLWYLGSTSNTIQLSPTPTPLLKARHPPNPLNISHTQ